MMAKEEGGDGGCFNLSLTRMLLALMQLVLMAMSAALIYLEGVNIANTNKLDLPGSFLTSSIVILVFALYMLAWSFFCMMAILCDWELCGMLLFLEVVLGIVPAIITALVLGIPAIDGTQFSNDYQVDLSNELLKAPSERSYRNYLKVSQSNKCCGMATVMEYLFAEADSEVEKMITPYCRSQLEKTAPLVASIAEFGKSVLQTTPAPTTCPPPQECPEPDMEKDCLSLYNLGANFSQGVGLSRSTGPDAERFCITNSKSVNDPRFLRFRQLIIEIYQRGGGAKVTVPEGGGLKIGGRRRRSTENLNLNQIAERQEPVTTSYNPLENLMKNPHMLADFAKSIDLKKHMKTLADSFNGCMPLVATKQMDSRRLFMITVLVWLISHLTTSCAFHFGRLSRRSGTQFVQANVVPDDNLRR